MCIPFTDVAQVANAARNYEILHERDDDGAERPDKRQKSGDRHEPTTQQSSHKNHGHDNDRHRSDRSSGNVRDQRNRGQQSNRPVNSGFQQSRGPSKGYSYPVCTTFGHRHPRECRRAAGTCFKCGQTGHLQKDCKKNTAASTSGQADKKPSALGRVFAITEDHATKTSGTITGTIFIYGHAVFVLFDMGATHSVISSVFASCVTTTPTLLDHVLCISTPMKDYVRFTHVYRDLPLQFDDKIHTINALLLDMCKFDIILGMDWLTEHHATIGCRSYRVIFGDIHAPEFIYHGSLPGKSMQIISALQARTLLSHGCEVFLATIHDTTSDVPSIHDQPIVFEFPDVFPDELPGIPPVREFDDKICAINALPLDMCEFDIILGMDWLTEHHATIYYRSYRVIFGDIHAPEFIYHGSLPRKSMQIISALQARTLLSHGCEGFLATIHDTTSDVPSIHDL
uniref:CCHC-type domain-containing protein n=1 Tax=Tanacetum cinerariifolium TaxID=118510 RepID=A0A699IIU4_TANCI|nr:hypothetical protein [Tanacetum cinerariifolium]